MSKSRSGKAIVMSSPTKSEEESDGDIEYEADDSQSAKEYQELLECILDENDRQSVEGPPPTSHPENHSTNVGDGFVSINTGKDVQNPGTSYHVLSEPLTPSAAVRDSHSMEQSEQENGLEIDYADPSRRVPGEKQPMYPRGPSKSRPPVAQPPAPIASSISEANLDIEMLRRAAISAKTSVATAFSFRKRKADDVIQEPEEQMETDPETRRNIRNFNGGGHLIDDIIICNEVHAVVDVEVRGRFVVDTAHNCVLTDKFWKYTVEGGCLDPTAILHIPLSISGTANCSAAVPESPAFR